MTTPGELASRAAEASFIGLCDVVQRMEIARHSALSKGGPKADTSALDHVIDASLSSIKNILVDFPEFEIWNRDKIQASFNKDFIGILDHHPKSALRIKIEDQDLRHLITIGSPELLELMIERGLGVGTQLPVLFSSLDQCGDKPRALEFAHIVATKLAPFEASQISAAIKAPALIDHSVYGITSPHFFTYLKAQAVAFPDDIQIALEKIFNDLDVSALLRFHLAGFTLEHLPATATMEYAGITALVQKMKSSHGRLEIQKHTGDLDTFLKTGMTTTVSAWIKTLGQRMEN